MPLLTVGVILGVLATISVNGKWWTADGADLVEDDVVVSSVIVERRSVGVQRSVIVDVEERTSEFPVAVAPGIITRQASVGEAPSLWIDELPVFVTEAPIPMFRDLVNGTAGADVVQFQQFLVSQSLLEESDVDGKFGSETISAARILYGLPQPLLDSISLGRFITVPQPVNQYRWPATVAVGASVEDVVQLQLQNVEGPVYSFEYQEGVELKIGSSVTVRSDPPVSALVAELRQGVEGQPVAVLSAVDGGAVCPAPCDGVLPDGTPSTSFRGTLIEVEAVDGPAVPLGALGFAEDGRFSVTLADGSTVIVTPQAQDGAFAVVSGIDVGDVVLLDEG